MFSSDLPLQRSTRVTKPAGFKQKDSSDQLQLRARVGDDRQLQPHQALAQ